MVKYKEDIELRTGNVYYVVPPTANSAWYTNFYKEHKVKYADGTQSVHSTIQSALDACTANRGDYVVVAPSSSDYDITAALTMSKARVHLICPDGIGWKGMTGNSARIHQNTAATDFITVTADNVEIAGFFFKQDATSRANIVYFSGTRWCGHVHDNFFGMSATASTSNYGVYGDGACSHMSIHDNFFTNYGPGAMTGTNNDIAAFIGFTAAGSTRNTIKDNDMMTGANTTVGAAILYAGYGGIIVGNNIWENVAFAGSDAGVLTLGISSSADCLVANNRIGITTGNAANGVSGGTANQSYVANYEGTSGGTALQ